MHDRALKEAAVRESLERDMQLLCVTGVEDRLQAHVRPTLELLRNAGIKVQPLGGPTRRLRAATPGDRPRVFQRTAAFQTDWWVDRLTGDSMEGPAAEPGFRAGGGRGLRGMVGAAPGVGRTQDSASVRMHGGRRVGGMRAHCRLRPATPHPGRLHARFLVLFHNLQISVSVARARLPAC